MSKLSLAELHNDIENLKAQVKDLQEGISALDKMLRSLGNLVEIIGEKMFGKNPNA